MSFIIQTPGLLTSIQDRGRFKHQRFGVPVSGPMDAAAFKAANQLVGNPDTCAGLEFLLQGPSFTVYQDCLIALTGRGFSLQVDHQPMPPWTSILVRFGQEVQITKTNSGNWGYLGVSGGFQVEKLMGSYATYLRGKIGGMDGKPLSQGDELQIGTQPGSFLEIAGCCIAERFQPAYQDEVILDVIIGPQEDYFTDEGSHTFYSESFQISHTSDRMGFRLDGPVIEHRTGADIISEGMIFGSIQVPASGQPIIMMAEHPTTGGYCKIATVASYVLPLLAQSPIGSGKIRFNAISVQEAQKKKKQIDCMQNQWLKDPIDLEFSDTRF
ncbi:MAG: biotin-dependent carboxyltransferase [Anaerolineaceae bacterium]|nr:biotin-dependent carboxyltransferase [Anaerolineaceae bacterium]